MAELGAESLISDSGSIHASQSEISMANSSPRMESNATSSTACIADVPTAIDLRSDMICPICNQLFDRPVMVSCGHSYCEMCIERHTRVTRNCLICGKDVGDNELMIPSITLDNIVRRMKEQSMITSMEDLYVCEERTMGFETKGKLERSISARSTTKRRCFFSIAGPTVCSSPATNVRRRPLSPSAKPRKSSLKLPPDTSYLKEAFDEIAKQKKKKRSAEVEGNFIITGHASLFRREGFGRRSERYTSATEGKKPNLNERIDEKNQTMIMVEDVAGEETVKMKRNSIFRRSLNALRSRSRTGTLRPLAEESSQDEKDLLVEKPEPQQKKAKTSIWRRLFKTSKISTTPAETDGYGLSCSEIQVVNLNFENFGCEENPEEEEETENENPLKNLKFGYYLGIGRKFERVAKGDEITVVVFGHSKAGKSTFVNSIKNLFPKTNNQTMSEKIRVIPTAERYLMAGNGTMPYPEGDNRLPNFVSLVVSFDDGSVKVVDIVDPEYDNSYLPQPYMETCDVAMFLVDTRNCASLLSTHQIQRNLKNFRRELECELVINVPSNLENRVLSASVCDNLAEYLKTRAVEMCVQRMEEKMVENLLLSICQKSAKKRPSVPSPGLHKSSSFSNERNTGIFV